MKYLCSLNLFKVAFFNGIIDKVDNVFVHYTCLVIPLKERLRALSSLGWDSVVYSKCQTASVRCLVVQILQITGQKKKDVSGHSELLIRLMLFVGRYNSLLFNYLMTGSDEKEPLVS